MKLTLLAFVGLVAVAAGMSAVCIPTPNQVETDGWFSDHDGFARGREILDVSKNAFRRQDEAFYRQGHRPSLVFQDVLILGEQQKTYYIEGHGNPPNHITCRVANGAVTIKDPCPSRNTTYLGTDTIGNSVVDSFYGEDHHQGRQTMYSNILITKDGIPVNVAIWTGLQHASFLYMNFNRTLPNDAWTVPRECNNAPVVPFTQEMKDQFRFHPHIEFH